MLERESVLERVEGGGGENVRESTTNNNVKNQSSQNKMRFKIDCILFQIYLYICNSNYCEQVQDTIYAYIIERLRGKTALVMHL